MTNVIVEDYSCNKCNDNGYWYQDHYTIYCKYCCANPDLEPVNPIKKITSVVKDYIKRRKEQ